MEMRTGFLPSKSKPQTHFMFSSLQKDRAIGKGRRVHYNA